MNENYYKVLNEDGSCFWGGSGAWYLPKGNKPGKWMPKIKGDLIACENAYHILRPEHLVRWLGPAIFKVEPRGEVIYRDDKLICREARLLSRLEIWNDRTARLFAADCAEHVLPIFQKHFPDDMRPALAIAAARSFEDGRITRDELAAAWAAARGAGWAAARAADWDAARDAARDAQEAETEWQTTRLFEYLKVTR